MSLDLGSQALEPGDTDRRQLTKIEIALAFKRLKEIRVEDGGAKRKMGRPAKGEEKSGSGSRHTEARSREQAAQLLGVGEQEARALETVFTTPNVPAALKPPTAMPARNERGRFLPLDPLDPRPRRKHKRKEPARQYLSAEPLHAIACAICRELFIATTRDAVARLSREAGWGEVTVAGVRGFWCAKCKPYQPPKTRADCIEGPRPCLALLCRYHLGDSISRKAGAGFELAATCALDVVDKNPDGMTLREVGAVFGASREFTREVLHVAIGKLQRAGLELEDPVADKPEPGGLDWAMSETGRVR